MTLMSRRPTNHSTNPIRLSPFALPSILARAARIGGSREQRILRMNFVDQRQERLLGELPAGMLCSGAIRRGQFALHDNE
jgi:hypothetical protein